MESPFLSENKLYSLNSTYKFYAWKNLHFRFKERQASGLENRGSNPGSGSNFSLEIEIFLCPLILHFNTLSLYL